MGVSACFPVSARCLLLITGLCTVAHGGFCGPWAPAGDGLWLVCTFNDLVIIFIIDTLPVYWRLSSSFIHQHAVHSKPGTCSYCHGSRSHPRQQRIPGVGSVFLCLHLQSVFSVCVCVSKCPVHMGLQDTSLQRQSDPTSHMNRTITTKQTKLPVFLPGVWYKFCYYETPKLNKRFIITSCSHMTLNTSHTTWMFLKLPTSRTNGRVLFLHWATKDLSLSDPTRVLVPAS